MKFETGICANCGADDALHHFETEQCPWNGQEETREDKLTGKPVPQRWADTIFEDAGIKALHDAAPKLLEGLRWAIRFTNDLRYKEQIEKKQTLLKLLSEFPTK